MKQKNLLFIVLVTSYILAAQVLYSQQTKPPAKPPAKSKTSVKISYDDEREFYYIESEETGSILKVLLYNKVYPFSEGVARVKSDQGIGYINEQGKEIVVPDGKYTWGQDFSQGMAAVGKLDEGGEIKSAGYINKTGALVVPLIYQHGKSFNENMAAVMKNGKWGYINKSGTLVIACQYKDAKRFKSGLAAVGKEVATNEEEDETLYGFIDKTGKQVIPFRYTTVADFRETISGNFNTYAVRAGKIYIIDKTGKEMDEFAGLDDGAQTMRIEWAWDDGDEIMFEKDMGYYSYSYFGVYSLGMNGFLIKPEYLEIHTRKEPTTGARFYLVVGSYDIDNKVGLVKTKNCQIPATYDYIDLQSGLVYALTNVNWEENSISSGDFELYDLDLKLLTTKKYEWITAFDGDLAYVLLNGKQGAINRRGEEVIPPMYDAMGTPGSGVIPVLKAGKVGLVNFKNEIIAPMEYQSISNFNGGYAIYTLDGRHGIMDSTGRRVTEPRYDSVGGFVNGLASYVENNKVGYINTLGEVVIPAEYQYGNDFSEGLALVMKDGMVGFIDTTGKTVIPFIYEQAEDFRSGYARVLANETISLINKQGTIIKTY